jgi:hypothetical protein
MGMSYQTPVPPSRARVPSSCPGSQGTAPVLHLAAQFDAFTSSVAEGRGPMLEGSKK